MTSPAPSLPPPPLPAAVAPAIEVWQVHKTYACCKALDGVNLTVEPGEMVALIGASGSGKSTLLRHIAGFVGADGKGSPGFIRVHGEVMQENGRISRRARQLRAGLGFVFQQFNLVPRLSVMTNVLVGRLHTLPWWRNLTFRFALPDRQKALEALVAVGIEQFAWQRAATLSGGQQQRAALARTLVQGARTVLADEPIASLDPESSRKVMEILATMNRDQGTTIVVSLHQVDMALRYCPRTVALHQGRVVYDGPSAELTPELLRRLYGSAADELFAPPGAPGTPWPAPAALSAA